MSETMQVTEAGAAPEAVGAMLGQLMGDFAATAGVILTELGLRLGLWDALAAGPATAETVAERAGAAGSAPHEIPLPVRNASSYRSSSDHHTRNWAAMPPASPDSGPAPSTTATPGASANVLAAGS